MRRALAGGLATIFALALGAATAYGANPPPNDTLGGAEPITIGVAATTDLTGATTDASDSIDCGPVTRSTWFKLTGADNGALRVKASGAVTNDLRLVSFRQSGTGTPVRLACGTGPELEFRTRSGSITYYIQVSDNGGGGTITLSFEVVEPPVNDNIATATLVESYDTTYVADIWSSWHEAGNGETLHCSAYQGTGHTVWYKLVATAEGTITADATQSTFPDQVLAAYRHTGGGGYGGGITYLDRCSDRTPLSFDVAPGATYFIQASDSKTPSITGGGILKIRFSFVAAPPRPGNDDLANATIVTEFPFADDTVDTSGATSQSGEPYCGGSARTVWYSMTPAGSGTVTIDPAGSAFPDAVVAVYRIDAYGGFSDPVCGTRGSAVSYGVQAGTTYLVQVADAESGGGSLHVAFDFTSPPADRPANDDLANAVVVDAFPFSDTVEIASASSERDEPFNCWRSTRTVWYQVTPAMSGTMTVQLTTTGSAAAGIYRAAGAGFAGLVWLACSGSWGPQTIDVAAGQTYYLQASDTWPGGNLGIDIDLLPPPPNDDFANASEIVAFPATASVSDIRQATREAGEPTPSCGGTTHTVWYRFTASEDGAVTVVSTPDSTVYEPVLAAYQAIGTGFAGLSGLGCVAYSSPLVFPVQTGNTYYVQASSLFSNTGALNLAFSLTSPPANDDFADATDASTLPFDDVVTIKAATAEVGEPSPGERSDRTVWYRVVAAESGILAVDPAGSGFNDVRLTLYRADGPGFAGLVQVASNGYGDRVNARMSAGSTYYLQASDIRFGGGEFTVHLSVLPALANDDFGMATVITGLPYTTTVDTGAGTRESGEPTVCSMSTRTAWYSFTAPARGRVSVDASASANAMTRVNAFVGSSPGLGGLGWLTCAGTTNPTTFAVVAGATYYLQVADNGYGYGPATFSLTFTPPPANDDLANAKVIAAFPFIDSVPLQDATSEPGENIHPPCGASPRTVWYAFTAPAKGRVKVDAGASTFGDTRLTIYRSTGPGYAGLTYLTCSSMYHDVSFDVLPDAVYYVQASDVYSVTGTLNLRVTLTRAPDLAPPSITISGNEGSYHVDQVVAFSVAATDDVDGALLPSCELVRDADGSVITTSCSVNLKAWDLGVGAFTIRAAATDESGKASSASGTFTVAANYGSMTNLTRAWVTKLRVADDLVAKLEAAARAEARKNFRIEQSILDDYRALLRAQTGKSISEADAQRLISFSNSL
jgi:hypothetical protein